MHRASGPSMYERHFGFTDLPFKLSPDPFFYFGSQQHQAALETVRQAFTRELPFLVLSGEVGAGKTTILRAWLPEVEAAGVAVGQIANTQLDADDLMIAISVAFGVEMHPDANGSRDAALHGFLRALHGRDALIVIDEAQNLSHDALRRLAALSDMAPEEGASLRICLVGQPELRANVSDPALHDFMSRVQHSSHLGALDAAQTQRYIEHRLRKVGWSGTPSFDIGAFDSIHQSTGGIPRRINVLCNRLLLAEFLGHGRHVGAQSVASAIDALRAETGEHALADGMQPCPSGAIEAPVIESGAILVVVSGRIDYIKSIALLRALGRRRDTPPAVLLAVSDERTWALDAELHAFAAISQRPLVLGQGVRPQPSVVASRFRHVLQSRLPSAVIVIDGDESSLCCAKVAHEARVPLVHIDSRACAESSASTTALPRESIGRLADLRFGDPSESYLHRTRCSSPFVGAGNLLIDSVHLAAQMAARRTRPDAYSAVRQYADKQRGYGIVALEQCPEALNKSYWEALVPVIRASSRELPLFWPLRKETMLALHESCIAHALAGERIVCIEDLGYARYIGLLREATCVLTDAPNVIDEAAAVGVACVWIGADIDADAVSRRRLPCHLVGCDVTRAIRAVWEVLFGMHQSAPVSLPGRDGHAAIRISAYLARWLIEFDRPVHKSALAAEYPPDAGCEAVGQSVD